MSGRKQDCVWLYLKIDKSTSTRKQSCKDAVRYANHVKKICRAYIVAQMKQHHKCMGCTAWGCIAWGCIAWGCIAWGCIAWGCIAWGCIAWGCIAWGCIAWGCIAWDCISWGCIALGCIVSLHGLHCIGCMFFCLGRGRG